MIYSKSSKHNIILVYSTCYSLRHWYLRNRKHAPCFYRVIQTRVEVWENEKCCGRRVFPQLFRVLLKVIPHNCIAHPFCAYFMASFSAPSCTRTLKTWQICLDIELCQLKNGNSSPTSTATPPFFQVIVIN